MYREAYAAAMGTTWAIYGASLRWMLNSLAGDHIEIVKPRRKLPSVSGEVAVLPLHGVISQRDSIWSELFGGTSTQQFGAGFAQAINDPRVKAVVLDVDSPGGTVAGVRELADLVYQGSQQKPVAAVANSQMASAAYWIGSQVGGKLSRLAAAPGSDVGSIGVFRMHEDISGKLEQEGVNVSFIAVPEFKTEANPFEPLSAEAEDHHMTQVQATYDQFVADVARGRGASKAAVQNSYGKGRVYHADQAAQHGMVDRVATLPQMLAELGVGAKATLSQAQTEMMEELCHAWETGLSAAIVPLPDPDFAREYAVKLRHYS